MSTTTIRLPDELKARIDTLAAQAGDSAHAFMIKTLDEATGRLELQREFHAEAQRRLDHMQETGEYLTLEDVRAYAQALVRKESPPRPTLRRMGPEELERFRASMQRAD
jgi:predicted transcriptional regulator